MRIVTKIGMKLLLSQTEPTPASIVALNLDTKSLKIAIEIISILNKFAQIHSTGGHG
jgi:hypothetical protein